MAMGLDDLFVSRDYQAQAKPFFVIFGDKDLASVDFNALGTGGFKATSTTTSGYQGDDLAAADLDGDGIDDIIVGAPWESSQAGTVHVIYGSEDLSSFPDFSAALGTKGFKITNSASKAKYFGEELEGGGDINGDGIDDFVIGSEGGTNSKFVSVVFGNAARRQGEVDLNTDKEIGFTIFGTDSGFGENVAMLGDVNGDGFDDVAIGVAGAANPAGNTGAGAVYILFGQASGFKDIDLSTGNSANLVVIMYGEANSDNLGRHVAAAGDVDGDGLADLLIGTHANKNYLILGKNMAPDRIPDGAKATTLTDGSQNIEGTSATGEFLQGSHVANVIGSIGTGDIAYGGAGDDEFSVVSTRFERIDGGSGTDTLKLSGGGMELDLSDHARPHARLDSIEKIDITGSGNNTLLLDKRSAYRLTEQRKGGKAELTIDGDSGDKVVLKGGAGATAGWTLAEDTPTGYDTYTLNNASLIIDADINVEFVDTTPKPRYADEARLYIPVGTTTAPKFQLWAGDYFSDDDGADRLVLSVKGFGSSAQHGVTALAIEDNVLTLTGDLASSFNKGATITATLVATDGDGFTAERKFLLEGFKPTAISIPSSGNSVSAVGDVNGDGFDDFLQSTNDKALLTAGRESTKEAASATTPRPSFAGADGSLVGSVAADSANFAGTVTVFNLFSIGDLNGDGRVDLFIAKDGSDPREVVFSFGGATARTTIDGTDIADAPNGGFLDINGDGIDDAIIGQSSSDKLHVVFGDTGLSGLTSALDLTTNTLQGATGSAFGTDIANAGDVNGDGIERPHHRRRQCQ